MRVAGRSLGATFRTGPDLRPAFCIACLVNFAITVTMLLKGRLPDQSCVWTSTMFWALLIVWPSLVDTAYLFQPRNYMFLLFFITIIVSPPVLYSSDTWLTRWILDYNPAFWSYVGYTLWLWLVAFAAYAVGLLKGDQPAPPPSWERRADLGHSGVVIALVLIGVGLVGLWMAAGSLDTLLSIRGQRTLAVELINVEGKGRYLVWFSSTSVGACLLWVYGSRRIRAGALPALGLLLAIYLPLTVFFSYTSGRAATVLPLLMLLNLYYLYCRRFSGWWVAWSLLASLPLFGIWSIYRQEGWGFSVDASVYSLSIEVLMGAFSRLDRSVAAVAGLQQFHVPLLYGETLLAAVLHPLPAWLVGRPFTGGTMAMARAIFGDASWDEASGMATPLLVEGLVNFGIVGVIVFHFLLGRLVRWTERLHRSSDPLVVVFGISLTFALPFGASLEVIHAGFIWNVLFPFAFALLLRRMLSLHPSIYILRRATR